MIGSTVDHRSGLSVRLLAWCVLRRVIGGGVVKLGTWWLDHGRPTPMHLADTFDAFTVAGLVVLADPDPITVGQRRATATDAGHTRYAELCRWQTGQLRSRAAPSGLAIIPAEGDEGSP